MLPTEPSRFTDVRPCFFLPAGEALEPTVEEALAALSCWDAIVWVASGSVWLQEAAYRMDLQAHENRPQGNASMNAREPGTDEFDTTGIQRNTPLHTGMQQ